MRKRGTSNGSTRNPKGTPPGTDNISMRPRRGRERIGAAGDSEAAGASTGPKHSFSVGQRTLRPRGEELPRSSLPGSSGGRSSRFGGAEAAVGSDFGGGGGDGGLLLRALSSRGRIGAHQLLEDALPLLGRDVPREVLRDALGRHLLVGRGPVHLRGAGHGLDDGVHVLLGELLGVKAAHLEAGHALLHGVHEAARGGHQRDGAVLHGVELDQPAGLEPGGHEHEVRAGGDVVRHRGRELDHARHHARVLLVEAAHCRLELLLARSEDDDLDGLSRLQQLGDGLDQDVHALLLLEAADEAKQRHRGVHREPRLRLQELLRGRLAGDDRGLVVLHVEELVLRRVPLCHIHAVHNALNAAHLPDHLIKLHTLLLVFCNLRRIIRRNRQQLVCRSEARPKPVDLFIHCHLGILLPDIIISWAVLVKYLFVTVFKLKPCAACFRELKLLKRLRPETALEGNVVHADCAFCVGVLTTRLVDVLQKDRQKGRVPVVRNDHAIFTETERQNLVRLERCFAEDTEAFWVIAVVGPRLLPIQHTPSLAPYLRQENRVVNEYTVDALDLRVEEAHLFAANSLRHACVPGFLVLVIPRRNRNNFVPPCSEGDRESPNNVSESTGF
mmetsp:Transcript_426/g.893  ORF Transcript_426/g.893 Transcript_426/m.893 type:complete len:614 (+) Transcript_426:182-2023(+)